jgi:predicted Ser/Thr protein kinase
MSLEARPRGLARKLYPAGAVACAGNNTIAALLAGAVDEAAAAALEVHLDRCTACRELVARLGRGLSAIHGAPVTRLPQVGARIGRYEIRRVVGAGGMGVVYEARDATLDRRVALKLLRPELQDADLVSEALAMARLQHANVVGVFDVGVTGGQFYICMEYVDGTTLRTWARGKRWREIVDVYRAAGEGLAYVHRAKIAHLDFKPDNVLVDRDGRARVTDFGLARTVNAPGRPCGGTPAYMAPEQLRGEADARSDQYAFCASLGETLAGTGPAWLQRVIARGLSNDRGDRYPSMRELLVALAPRPRRLGGIAVIAATAAVALAVTLPSRPAPETRFIERPTTRLVDWSMPMAVPVPVEVERAPAVVAAANSESPRGTIATPGSRRDFTPAIAMLARAASRTPSAMHHQLRTTPASSSLDDHDAPSLVIEVGPCDDSQLTCTFEPPECPTDATLAIQSGCWTCCDPLTCAPLGGPWVVIAPAIDKPDKPAVDKPPPRPVHPSAAGSNAGSGAGSGSSTGSGWGSAGGPGSNV